MYAVVPCCRLGTLHKLIRRDLPPSPPGLRALWLQILEIQRRWKDDSAYGFQAALPTRAISECPA